MENIASINKYQPNGSKEEVSLGILHNVNGYYVSNEGTKSKPNFHVWVPDGTCCQCDSAYNDITLAVCRCDYLAKNNVKLRYKTS
jgi:hypothetical protein